MRQHYRTEELAVVRAGLRLDHDKGTGEEMVEDANVDGCENIV